MLVGVFGVGESKFGKIKFLKLVFLAEAAAGWGQRGIFLIFLLYILQNRFELVVLVVLAFIEPDCRGKVQKQILQWRN